MSKRDNGVNEFKSWDVSIKYNIVSHAVLLIAPWS